MRQRRHVVFQHTKAVRNFGVQAPLSDPKEQVISLEAHRGVYGSASLLLNMRGGTDG